MILHSLNTSSEYSACWPEGCARFAVGVTQTSQCQQCHGTANRTKTRASLELCVIRIKHYQSKLWSLDSTKYLGHKFSFDMLPLSIDIFNCVLLLLLLLFDDVVFVFSLYYLFMFFFPFL